MKFRNLRLPGAIGAFSLVLTAFGSTLFAAGDPKAADDRLPKATTQPSHYEIKTEAIEIDSGRVKIKGYLAKPVTDRPAPGLLLIHEWYGLNDWVKQQADRFAEKGYVALAVDLYRGDVAADAERAHELMRGLPDERALGDMQAAFRALALREEVKGEKTGVIGWCMGGGYALRLAIEQQKLDAVVMCYGKPVTDPNILKQIHCPLLGIWGADDHGIDVDTFKAALKEAKVDSKHHVYPGAGHAFLNESNKRGYNKEQATKAWKVIDDFFAEHLRRKPVGSQVEEN